MHIVVGSIIHVLARITVACCWGQESCCQGMTGACRKQQLPVTFGHHQRGDKCAALKLEVPSRDTSQERLLCVGAVG